MARRSRMSVLKRQRELRKAEKAASKRAKRHGGGGPEDQFTEPRPTVRFSDFLKPVAVEDAPDEDDGANAPSEEEEKE